MLFKSQCLEKSKNMTAKQIKSHNKIVSSLSKSRRNAITKKKRNN